MADIPFVDENFQRSFRNTFPSQTSTGRDLHVSDVVIPVVDFTPTASGTSLPSYMQLARNGNTKTFAFNSAGTSTLTGVTPGFWSLDIDCKSTGQTLIQFFLNSGATNFTFMNINGITSATLMQDRDITIFIPVGFGLQRFSSVTSGSLQCDVSATPIADVNGNLINPYNYDPQ